MDDGEEDAPYDERRMKYHIWTIGCQMNEADSRHLASRLEQAGCEPCDRAEAADLVVLNTCVVRQQAEDKVYSRLRYVEQLKRRRPDLQIALMGCLVGTRDAPASKLKERLAFVDFFLPPSDPSRLLAALRRAGAAGGEAEEAEWRSNAQRDRLLRDAVQNEESHVPASGRGAVSAYVPVVLGCSHACTYCIIPYRRGAERSRPAEAVLAEARQLASEGVRELVLLGQIVDRYGLDIAGGPDLADLLRQLGRIDGIDRLRFLTSHPAHLTDRLIETVARQPKICPLFELPVQAGDDAVLRRMKRGYTVARYRDLVARIRSAIPEAAIHTDIIVGFPGETGEQFMGSHRLLEDLRLDNVHLARYSVRPQTYAARRFADDVPPAEKERRWLMLDDLQRGIQGEKNARYLGKTVRVLVEDRDEKRNRWRGRTRDDRLVCFSAPGSLRGRTVDVRIEWTGPYSLIGRSEHA